LLARFTKSPKYKKVRVTIRSLRYVNVVILTSLSFASIKKFRPKFLEQDFEVQELLGGVNQILWQFCDFVLFGSSVNAVCQTQ
jgi:hypothetical protein